jgi:AcrR family transcriptional regulator
MADAEQQLEKKPRLRGRPPSSESSALAIRNAMLEAATRLFSENSFEAVSIREIADQAGTTLSALYHYFGDKRSLYLETYRREFRKSSARLEKVFRRDKAPEVCLFEFVTELVKVQTEPGPLFNMLSRHLIDRNEDLRTLLAKENFPNQVHYVVETIGRLCPDRDAAKVAIEIYALVFGLIAIRPVYDVVDVLHGSPTQPLVIARRSLTALLPEIDWASVSPA